MIRSTLLAAVAATLALGGPSHASAQDRARSVSPADGIFSALTWRDIGPAITGGRVTDIAVALAPGRPDAVYVGAASGGVFRSTNRGTSWEPLFDGIDGLISVGDIAVAPSNPDVIWVGTGEANYRQSTSWGEGVYKSMDGGRSWTHVGLRESRHVGRIVIHPTDAEVVYVAALGHLWGPNAERGVFKTADGGATWTRVLAVDDNTGAVDLAISPDDPAILFAATYQRRHRAWGFNGGGPGSGIHRSLDGGETWTKLTAGLPSGTVGRIGLDIFRQDGRIVYAVVEGDPRRGATGLSYEPPDPSAKTRGGVFRSEDRGDTWEHLSNLNPRPSYFSQIRIDPHDPNRVYLLGESFHVSDDGGRTFSTPAYGSDVIHPDHHALWIDPRDSNHLIVGNDGGVAVSWDRAETWRVIDNIPIAQFYHVSADARDPYHVCGGLQDNGSWCVPSATRSSEGSTNRDAYNVGGSDGFAVYPDQSDDRTLFVTSWGGWITRLDLLTREGQAITPTAPPATTNGDAAEYRWNWDAPVVMSHHDSNRFYAGRQFLLKSTDRGLTWSVVSPDLTAQIDRDTLSIMGVRVTGETLSANDGVSFYGTLTSISESPLNPSLLYTGSDDGQLQVSDDGGRTWLNVTGRIPRLPPYTRVSTVLASRHVEGRVYASFDGHYNDDYRPHVYVSNDHGRSWKPLAGGLPETSVNAIVEHPRNPSLLFVGHEKGLHFSSDGGATWWSLKNNMPSAPVDDVVIHERDNDLIAGTHGRGIWILDDIGPLEALTRGVLEAGVHVFAPRPARLWVRHRPQSWSGSGAFVARNPPAGAMITYYLRDSVADVSISIRDSTEHELRTLRGTTNRGLNRVTWDLRRKPPYEPADSGVRAPAGPTVLPGTYEAILRVVDTSIANERRSQPSGHAEYTVTVVVESDPVAVIPADDRLTRHRARMDAYRLQTTVWEAQAAVRRVAEVLRGVASALANGPPSEGAAAGGGDTARVTALRQETAAIEADLALQKTRLEGWRGLVDVLDDYSGRPTVSQLHQVDAVRGAVARTVTRLNQLLSTDVTSLLEDLRGRGLWPALPPPIVIPIPSS